VLELRGLRVAYGRVEVVHGIDLSLAVGEVVGVIGPNGAGKSSVLRAICGLQPPRAGEVNLDGRRLNGLAPEQIARLGIALVPERRQIFKSLTVEENLRLGCRSDDSEALGQVGKRFPVLLERAGQRADRLSGGEQQQLALARALVGRPRLLILDEPSLGLAPKMIDAVYQQLGGLREEGVTMLLVEQNAKRTIAFCDRTIVLGGGVVRAEGSRKELQADPDLLRAYLGGQP
jgi:branched-chain amino acid transport system ATP-binding protein